MAYSTLVFDNKLWNVNNLDRSHPSVVDDFELSSVLKHDTRFFFELLLLNCFGLRFDHKKCFDEIKPN